MSLKVMKLTEKTRKLLNEFLRKANKAIAIRVYNTDNNLLNRNNCQYFPYIWNKHITKFNNTQ